MTEIDVENRYTIYYSYKTLPFRIADQMDLTFPGNIIGRAIQKLSCNAKLDNSYIEDEHSEESYVSVS